MVDNEKDTGENAVHQEEVLVNSKSFMKLFGRIYHLTNNTLHQ